MKKLLVLLTAMSVIGGAGVSLVSADETANISITVQIQSLGVSVTPTSWGIGVVSAGSSQNSTAFTVTNTGNVVEKFQLNTANSANWTNANTSSQGGSAGVNQFVLKGLFDNPATEHTFATNDDITNTATTASDTIFSDGDDTGTNVGAGATKSLYLQLGVPTAGSNTNAQTINVTITALAQ